MQIVECKYEAFHYFFKYHYGYNQSGDVIRKSIPKGLEDENEIANFVKSLMEKSEEWKAMKIVVLGHGEIGKTTLLDAFKKIREDKIRSQMGWFRKVFHPTSRVSVSDIIQTMEYLVASRTIGVDHSKMTVGSGEVTIWDFGGQLEYTVTHHFFLSIEVW